MAALHDSLSRRSRFVRVGSAIDACLSLALSTELIQVLIMSFQRPSNGNTAVR